MSKTIKKLAVRYKPLLEERDATCKCESSLDKIWCGCYTCKLEYYKNLWGCEVCIPQSEVGFFSGFVPMCTTNTKSKCRTSGINEVPGKLAKRLPLTMSRYFSSLFTIAIILPSAAHIYMPACTFLFAVQWVRVSYLYLVRILCRNIVLRARLIFFLCRDSTWTSRVSIGVSGAWAHA